MDPVLSQSEVEELLRGAGTEEKALEVRPVDLVARDHRAFALLPELQRGADAWVGELENLLTQQFRMPCSAKAEPVEIVPGSQIGELIGSPRFSFAIEPAAGLIAVDETIAGPYVTRQFGGDLEQAAAIDAQPTDTELRTVSRMAARAAGLLQRALRPACTFTGKVEHRPPKSLDGVAALLFVARAEFGKRTGSISVAISSGVAQFRSAVPFQRPRLSVGRSPLRDDIDRVHVGVSSVLGGCDTTVGQFLSLKIGDVLTLDTPIDGLVPLLVEGRPKFEGSPVLNRGSLSLAVKERYKE